MKLVALPGTTRANDLTVLTSLAKPGDLQSGGVGGRNWPADDMRSVRQPGAVTLPGLVPTQLQGRVGTTPFHVALEPSVSALAMTAAATALPSAIPASTSLAYCTPASTREVAASAAMSRPLCAAAGRKGASTIAA